MIWFIVGFLVLHAVLIMYETAEHRGFQLVLFVVHLYYCFFGYYYWIIHEDGFFIDRFWEISDISRSLVAMSAGIALISLSSTILGQLPFGASAMSADEDTPHNAPIPRLFWILAAISVAAYGLLTTFHGEEIDLNEVNSTFNIAIQFTDMSIALILYLIATRRNPYVIIALLMAFALYWSFFGIRSKLITLALPLMLFLLVGAQARVKTWLMFLAAGLIMFLWFSVLSITRDFLNGTDLSRIEGKGLLDNLLVGFASESNIVFGMTAAFKQFLEQDIAIGLMPIYDVIYNFIPKVLWPDRETGLYSRYLMMGFLTAEGYNSKTAYPIIAEFMMMYGWTGIVLGCAVMAAVYRFAGGLSRRYALDDRRYTLGVLLVATCIGYIAYTRGFLSLPVKVLVFVYIPYVLLLRAETMDVFRKQWIARGAPDD